MENELMGSMKEINWKKGDVDIIDQINCMKSSCPWLTPTNSEM